MDASLKDVVSKSRLNSANDDAFISNINKLTDELGADVLAAVFQLLVGVDVPPKQLARQWENTQHHRQTLRKLLDRDIDIASAMCDYLQTNTDYLQFPCLREMTEIENVIHDTIHDKLTGLFNRNYFDQTYKQQISFAKRYKEDFAILFLDLDDFKFINDTHGHLAGDRVLQEVGKVIRTEKRDSDIAARYGGEEFVLLMNRTDNISAFVCAERLRKSIEQLTIKHGNKRFRVTISGGIASYPYNTRSPEKLLRMADNAVYISKGAGKNCISHFKEEKRRYLRVKINQPVMVKKLDFSTSKIFAGHSKDICVGGILFENPEPLPLGTLITVKIDITGKQPIILIGNVVRIEAFAENKYDIGMTTSFKELDKTLTNEIACILQADDQEQDEQMF
jgi:diguanylate cyclase (GGDEF)-like protein